MSTTILDIAAGLVAAWDRQGPMDAVLRQGLAGRRALTPDERRAVARAVFCHGRWLGWLDSGQSGLEQVRNALKLQQRFDQAPRSFAEEELRTRAVPNWISGEMKVPAAWLRHLQQEPVLWLRARRGQGRTLARQLGHCRPAGKGVLADALAYEGSEDLFRTPGFHAGAFEIQDLSSQGVGWMAAPRPGEVWWDVCAGEGGKTLHWSDLMSNQGLIWASDRAPWRLQRLQRRAARAGVFNYRTVVWHNPSKLPTKTRFHGVLVDAPCSGLGTWQRNPHARWTTTSRDLQELAALQLRLLQQTAAAVRPGGRLVYAVCTLTRVETDGVAEALERNRPDFQPWATADPWQPERAPVFRHCFWPQDHGGNGMFIAVWQRKS